MRKIGNISKKYFIVIIAILAVGLLVFSEFSENETQISTQENEENRIEQKLSDMIENLDGISRADVIVTIESYEDGKGSPYVRGVAIICHGKQKDDVKFKIIMMVSTALGVSSDKIFVSFS